MKYLTKEIMFNEKDKNSIKEAIFHLYENYKDFMNCPNLPVFEIRFFHIEPKFARQAYIESPTSSRPSYILNVCIELLLKTTTNMIPTLYHEFTHIYDLEHYALCIDIDKRSSVVNIFTEFHATLIQLKMACGFSCENDRKHLSLNDNIIDISPAINTISEYMQAKKKTIKQVITSFDQNKTNASFYRLIDYMCYELANKHFIETYINKFEYDDEACMLLYDKIGEPMLKIDILLTQYDINDITLKLLLDEYITIKRILLK